MLASYRQSGNRSEFVLHMPRAATRVSRSIAIAAALLSSLATAGCGGNGATLGDQAAGLKCVDDSNVCISQRKQVFDSYMADNSRAWVKQPAGPHEYASGVRLLALSKKRKELSCEELAHAKAEADRAPSALSGCAYSGLTPSQIARGVMLARDVSRELDREIARRCRKT